MEAPSCISRRRVRPQGEPAAAAVRLRDVVRVRVLPPGGAPDPRAEARLQGVLQGLQGHRRHERGVPPLHRDAAQPPGSEFTITPRL